MEERKRRINVCVCIVLLCPREGCTCCARVLLACEVAPLQVEEGQRLALSSGLFEMCNVKQIAKRFNDNIFYRVKQKQMIYEIW